ncbi:pyridoxamine 5'-phosphate oxidase family protein [Secundilactobacillus kimchicus]|uniref:pyridoxamine 5'-phosphate oxidase family protein n=1 Tax=Secundilactobacillus kimchicus TaxID=528209 RepID=UPI0035201CB0
MFVVASVDKMGFPSQVALTPLPPLPLNKSINSILFYTDKSKSTTRNITNGNKIAIFSYNQQNYSSICLKGHFRIISEGKLSDDIQKLLNRFQRELTYTNPVILQFNTMSCRLRNNNEITTDKLDKLSSQSQD